MLLPDVYSLRVTLILSEQVERVISFFLTFIRTNPLIFLPHLGLAASSIRQEGVGGRKAACVSPAR